jgi:WD40 repeat protein
MRPRVFAVLLLAWPGLLLAQDPAAPRGDGANLQIAIDPGGHVGPINALVFSPDGKRLLTAGEDKTIQVWDVESGERLRVLRPPAGPFNAGVITCAALSSDGRTLAVGGHGVQRTPRDDRPTTQFAYLLNLESGRILGLAGLDFLVEAVGFSPDGDRAAACAAPGGNRDADQVFVWHGLKDVWDRPPADGKVPLWKTLQFRDNHFDHVVFSPDGSRVAAASEGGNKTVVWELVQQGKAVPPVKVEGQGASATLDLAWDRDGKRLAVAHKSANPKTRLLNVWSTDGALQQSFDRQDFDALGAEFRAAAEVQAFFVAFRSDAELVAGVTLGRGEAARHAVVLADLKGKRLRSLLVTDPGPAGARGLAALSADGQRLALRSPDGNGVRLLDLADPAKTSVLGDHPRPRSVGWGPQGHVIAWSSGRRRDGRSFDRLDLTALETRPAVEPSALRRDVRRLDGWEVRRPEGERTLVVLRDGKEVRRIPLGRAPTAFTLIGRGDAMRLASSAGDLDLFDLATGKPLQTFAPTGAFSWDVAASPDQKYLLSVTDREVLHVYRPDRAEPLLTVFARGDDWIAWTADGTYAATPGGEKLMGWTVTTGLDRLAEFHPAASFRKRLYRPDVIRLVLEKGDVAEALKADVARLLPPRPSLVLLEKKRQTVKLKATAEAAVRDQPVTSLRLLVDGRPLPDGKGVLDLAQAQAQAEQEWEIQLPPGDHELKLLARSADTAATSEVVHVPLTRAIHERPVLHLVTVGIDRYRRKGLRLDCAAEDARALDGAFRAGCAGSDNLFGKVTGDPLIDEKATRDAVLGALKEAQREAKPGDLLVFSFAGHGVKQGREFFLLTVEADPGRLPLTAVSGKDLRAALAAVPCQVLLLLDACHPAEALRDFQPATDEAARALTDDECGAALLCAALASEQAEAKDGHGLFSRAVIEALEENQGVPFNRHDHRQYVHHLGAFVQDEVREMSHDRQHPIYNLPWVTEPFPIRQVPERPGGGR